MTKGGFVGGYSSFRIVHELTELARCENGEYLFGAINVHLLVAFNFMQSGWKAVSIQMGFMVRSGVDLGKDMWKCGRIDLVHCDRL